VVKEKDIREKYTKVSEHNGEILKEIKRKEGHKEEDGVERLET